MADDRKSMGRNRRRDDMGEAGGHPDPKSGPDASRGQEQPGMAPPGGDETADFIRRIGEALGGRLGHLSEAIPFASPEIESMGRILDEETQRGNLYAAAYMQAFAVLMMADQMWDFLQAVEENYDEEGDDEESRPDEPEKPTEEETREPEGEDGGEK